MKTREVYKNAKGYQRGGLYSKIFYITVPYTGIQITCVVKANYNHFGRAGRVRAGLERYKGF